jgi:hypothetical protein
VIDFETYLKDLYDDSLCPFCDVVVREVFACEDCWLENNLELRRNEIDCRPDNVDRNKAICQMVYYMAYEIRINKVIEKELLK